MENQINLTLVNAFFERQARRVYLPAEATMKQLITELQKWFAQQKELTYHIKLSLDEHYIFSFTQKTGLSAGEFYLLLTQTNNKVYYGISKATEFDEDANKGSLLGRFFSGSDTDHVELALLETARKLFQSTTVFYESVLNENFDQHRQNWFLAEAQPGDELLAFLDVSEIKKHPDAFDYDDKMPAFFVVTLQKQWLVVENDKKEYVVAEIPNTHFEYKSEIGRNTVKTPDYTWLTTRSNTKLYEAAARMIPQNPYDRLKTAANANFYNPSAKTQHQPFGNMMLDVLYQRYSKPIDLLIKIFVSDLVKKDQLPETDNLSEVLAQVLDSPTADTDLLDWQQNWQISDMQAIGINHILFSLAEKHQYQSFIVFHRTVREHFLKKNKDLIEQSVFDIQFARHLIAVNQNNEAEKILLERLKHLPDESIADLLPDDKTDPTETKNGQVLKITILDILAQISTPETQVEYLRSLAMLQPLVEKRLSDLQQHARPELAVRVEHVLALLKGQQSNFASNRPADTPKINTKQIDKYLKHPASRKGGSFDSLQKWLAKIEVPDHAIVKTYSEQVTPNTNPKLFEIIDSIAKALEIKGLETYVAHGQKAVGISSFEGKIPFLVIGAKHLQEDSGYYLYDEELRFIIGRELAGIYFKYARITSNDVWKGAMDKGSWMIDTFFSAIPLVGFVGNTFKTANRLTKIVDILAKAETINTITKKSKELVVSTNQKLGILKLQSNNATKEQELIATSRVMQLTADRAGLVFSQQLDASVYAIFKQSDFYQEIFEQVHQYGLESILHHKTDQGNFTYLELAIRLAQLFSFYLSEDFEKIVAK